MEKIFGSLFALSFFFVGLFFKRTLKRRVGLTLGAIAVAILIIVALTSEYSITDLICVIFGISAVGVSILLCAISIIFYRAIIKVNTENLEDIVRKEMITFAQAGFILLGFFTICAHMVFLQLVILFFNYFH